MNCKLVASLTLFLLLVFLVSPSPCAQRGFSGTLHFRNGQSVFFDHLGDTHGAARYVLKGRLGSQEVEYEFADLSQLIFSEKEPSTVIIANREKQRFTITDCRVWMGAKPAAGSISYVYNDPVTHALKESSARLRELTHIAIGERSGTSKLNPKTGEFFPAMFLFDPFTGEELVWAESGAPAQTPAPTTEQATPTPETQEAQAAPAVPKPTEPTPKPTEPTPDMPTPKPAEASATDLRLVVNTPTYAVFFLSDVKLTVVLRGPEQFERTVKDANPEKAYTFVFESVPTGEYKVTAKYGSRTVTDRINVTVDTSEFQIDFD